MAWTDHTWVTGETITGTLLNALRDNFRFLHDRGGDLASAATITPTTGFHKVTGTTTVDNIASPTDGHVLVAWFTGAVTFRHNGGGTGNIRTATGADRTVSADTIVVFRSDGTVWREVGIPAAVVQYADSKLAVDTAAFDFQNIPAAGHLEIFAYARTTQAADPSELRMQFNGDTASNYDSQRLRAKGATVDATDAQATSFITMGDIPGSTSTANRFGAIGILIPHYANATQMKPVVGKIGTVNSTASGGQASEQNAGLWRSTAAINRVRLFPPSGNLLTASRGSVYARSAA